MRHYLIQHGGASAVPYLTRLADRLPEGFADRPGVVLKNLGPPSDDSDAPRVVATIDPESDEELITLRDAVSALNNPSYALAAGPARTEPALTTADPLEALAGLLPDLPDSVETSAGPDPFPVLKEIFDSSDSGVDFPEKTYDGEKKAAYNHIVTHFGVHPYEDRANVIRPGVIAALQRPDHIPEGAWRPVVAHLEDEVLFFTFAREWMGDNGHIQTLRDRQRVIDLAFLKTLGEEYLGLGGNKSVSLVVDTMFQLSFIAISKLGGPSATVSSILRVLWDTAAAALPDPKARTTAKISEMEQELLKLWVAQMGELENQHAKINGDWGLLEKFGMLVKTRALQWPEQLGAMRRACSAAYQLYAIQQTMRIAPIGAEWVLKEEVKCDGVRKKAGWWIRFCHPKSSKNCYHDWALKSKSYKTGEWCFIYYLGHKHHDPLSRQDSYLHADRPIQRKLFGTDTKSETDPEFAFPSRFLADPNCTERQGWNLPQIVL